MSALNELAAETWGVARHVIVTFLFLSSVPAAAQLHYSWPIGVEREVDEGVYMSVVAARYGWRVWKIETKSGITCDAVKSAIGRPHPIPLGAGAAFFGGTPYLKIYKSYKGGSDYGWFTEHYGNVRVKIRQPGAKFWDEHSGSGVDMTKYPEGNLQVTLTSWEYPAVLVGFAEEKATFDLAGRDWASAQVINCGAKEAERG